MPDCTLTQTGYLATRPALRADQANAEVIQSVGALGATRVTVRVWTDDKATNMPDKFERPVVTLKSGTPEAMVTGYENVQPWSSQGAPRVAIETRYEADPKRPEAGWHVMTFDSNAPLSVVGVGLAFQGEYIPSQYGGGRSVATFQIPTQVKTL